MIPCANFGGRSAETCRIGCPPGFHLALQVECQLLAKKEVLRFEGGLRMRPEQQELEGISDECKKGGEQTKHGQTSSHGPWRMPRSALTSNPAHHSDLRSMKYRSYRVFAEHNWVFEADYCINAERPSQPKRAVAATALL